VAAGRQRPFVLVDRNGSVSACIQISRLYRETAQNYFHHRSMRKIPVTGGSETTISTRPSYNPFTSVPRTEGPLLGFLVIGYEIDDRLAQRGKQGLGSQVRFCTATK